MPTYKVTSPDGKVLRLTGDKPPSKEQLDKIFAQVSGSAPSASSADWTPAAQPGAEKQFAGGFLQRATVGVVNNSRAGQGAQNAQAVEVESVRKLQEAATNEQDPTKRAAYQKLAEDANARLQSNLSGRKSQMLGNTGWSAEEQNKYATDPLAYAGSIAKDAGQGALDVGSVIAPPLKAAQGANMATRAGVAGANGLISGTLSGTAQGMQADSLQEVGSDVLKGSAVGAGTGVAMQGVMELLGLAAKGVNKVKNGAVDTYRGTLKDNASDEQFYKQFGGRDNVAKRAMGRDVPKTKEGVRKAFEKYQPEFEKKVETSLGRSKKIAQTDVGKEYSEILTQVEREIKDEFGNTEGKQQFKDAMAYLKAKQTETKGVKSLDSINRERVRIDKIVGKTPTNEVKSGEQFAEKLLAGKLRNLVKNKLPELKPEFEMYQLLSGLQDAMTKEPKVGLAEVAGASPFAIAGLASKDPLTALMIMLGGAGFIKAVRSPGLRRAGATSVSKLPTLSSKVGTASSIAPTSAFMNNAMDRMSSQPTN